METLHYFDSAATTQVYNEALEELLLFNKNEFGNPSSSHLLGRRSAQAIRKARVFFADNFKVEPDQVIFTGSGTESDNLAINGVAFHSLAQAFNSGTQPIKPKIVCSATEHAAVKKSVLSLCELGFQTDLLKVTSNGQIDTKYLKSCIDFNTILASIHRVNNITGTLLDIECLAQLVKSVSPMTLFHTDCIQAFGKVSVPDSNSEVDLVSISAHKIGGPKGVGALIVLNRKLLKDGLRPLVWGGEQEGGFRSGTQNTGLISAFEVATRIALSKQNLFIKKMQSLKDRFLDQLQVSGLLVHDISSATKGQSATGKIVCNSPTDALPHIVNLSIPGFPPGPIAKLLEEQRCIVSTGSACSSHKSEPDTVLAAMGLPSSIQTSAIRISFSDFHTFEDIDYLAQTLKSSIQTMIELFNC